MSALGTDTAAFWTALTEGRSGIGPISVADASGLKFSNGAEVSDFDPEGLLPDETVRVSDRFSQLALVAAEEAIRDAGIEWGDELRARTAVVTGSCLGGQTTEDKTFERFYGQNRRRAHPLSVPRVMANAGASLITMKYGLGGPSFTVSTACASSAHAIGQAFWLVRSGVAEMALTGGSEAPFSPGHLAAWDALRVVAKDTCRPFSKNRGGMILGEGGALVVLEPLESARERGAEIYGEIVGFGMSADGHHLTQPSVEGPAAAMQAALDDAGLGPSDVGYVNAHGTGTQANDSTEAAAIRRVFGEASDGLAVSSTKSMHGHTLGAAGALEAVATVLALRHSLLPPTANFVEVDPECDLDVVPNTARPAEVDAALSSSFAFGGLNAVLAFRRV